MSQSYKHVCVACRIVKRTRTYGAQPPCPECGDVMLCAGYDFKTPKKSDDRGWEETARYLKRRNRQRVSWRELDHEREVQRLLRKKPD